MQEFDSDVENISTYLERLQLYMEANSIEDGKKVSVLHKQCQQANGSILEYVADQLSIRCQFREFLDQALRDHFVIGI